jgi:hypothetical protein
MSMSLITSILNDHQRLNQREQLAVIEESIGADSYHDVKHRLCKMSHQDLAVVAAVAQMNRQATKRGDEHADRAAALTDELRANQQASSKAMSFYWRFVNKVADALNFNPSLPTHPDPATDWRNFAEEIIPQLSSLTQARTQTATPH